MLLNETGFEPTLIQNNQDKEQDVDSECPSENPEKPSHPALPMVIARFLHNAPMGPNEKGEQPEK